MSFGCHRVSKKTPKNLTNFLPKNLKSGQINKINPLFYDNMIYIGLYGLFCVLKTLYGAVTLWFDHFLDTWVEICQIFWWVFGNSMTPKRHSEINWPLDVIVRSRCDCAFADTYRLSQGF